MQWVLDNWVLVLLVGGMFAMHLGHGMHGGKRGHGASDHGDDEGAVHGICKNTGYKCCGGHKKQPDSEPETKLANASETVIGKSQIPKIL